MDKTTLLCRIPILPKVLSFDSFYKMCLGRQKHNNRRWGDKLFECEECACGHAIAAGKLTRLPDNIQLIKEDAMFTPKPTITHVLPDDPWTGMPEEMIARITPSELRSYWKVAPLKNGIRGKCPNCLRDDMTCSTFGMCGACRHTAQGRTGPELLEALRKRRAELCGTKKQPRKAGTRQKQRTSPHETTNPAKTPKKATPHEPTLIDVVRGQLQHLEKTLCAKNADYSGGRPLGNFALSEAVGVDPFTGVMVRLGDKFSRACNLTRREAMVKDETIEDTLLDLAGYALIGIAVRRLQGMLPDK